MLIDLLGIKAALVFFSFLTIVGQLLFTFVLSNQNFPLSLVERAIFGIGYQNIFVGLNTMTARWFKGERPSFAE